MTRKTILFSVIIPTYNRSTLLMEAIESVRSQSVKEVEIIVVDDGSSDDTASKLQSLGWSNLFYHHQSNQGQSAARNLGVEKASGEYIIFMDDDDYWLPEHLAHFQEAINRNAGKLKIYRTGFLREYSDRRKVLAENYINSSNQHPLRWAAYHMCGLISLCIPKSFLQTEKSPVGFPHWQDTHLILRLLAQHPFEQLPYHTYVYRIHPEMGSLQQKNEDGLWQRANINVAAMEDLFTNYGSLVNPFLPKSTKNYLVAEKYLEYANLEVSSGAKKHHWRLLRKSLTAKIDLRFWKQYLLFFKYLLLG